jgi:hypothetical protein
VPTLSFRVAYLVGALAAVSVGVWGIANVSGPLRTASSPSSSGRLALPAHVASGTAAEDDTREVAVPATARDQAGFATARRPEATFVIIPFPMNGVCRDS